MKIISTIIYFVLVTTLFSCKTLFEEDFNNNEKNWELYNDSKEFLVNISDGKLHIEKFSLNRINNGCLWYNKAIKNFDTTKDFSIMFIAKINKCDDVINYIDFQWGDLKDQRRLYQIEFGTSGSIRLNYFDENWSYMYKKSLPINNTTSSGEFSFQKMSKDNTAYYPIKINDFNKYEIIQHGDLCTIKINDIKVLSEKIKPTTGHSIGIQQCIRSSWDIDKIVIKQKH